jgi:hypothetical protein
VNVRFCRYCLTLILSDFRYCPYCGARASRGPGIEEALGGPFSRIEASRADIPAPAEGGRGREGPGDRAIEEAAESLARLEADMDLLLETIEREESSSAK